MTREFNQDGGRVADLQSHARALAAELRAAKVSFDTVVREEQSQAIIEGWEAPARDLPVGKTFALGSAGLYTSIGPRIMGREVRSIDERDVLPKILEQVVRQSLYNLEKKHDIFNKLKQIKEE